MLGFLRPGGAESRCVTGARPSCSPSSRSSRPRAGTRSCPHRWSRSAPGTTAPSPGSGWSSGGRPSRRALAARTGSRSVDAAGAVVLDRGEIAGERLVVTEEHLDWDASYAYRVAASRGFVEGSFSEARPFRVGPLDSRIPDFRVTVPATDRVEPGLTLLSLETLNTGFALAINLAGEVVWFLERPGPGLRGPREARPRSDPLDDPDLPLGPRARSGRGARSGRARSLPRR